MSSTNPSPVDFSSRVGRFFAAARVALADELIPLGQKIESYFGRLRSELVKAGEEIEAYNRQHSNRFNVFDYIRPNENGLSDILADLLDPRGRHGQGDAFLRLFAKRLGVSFPADRQGVKIYREETTTYISNPLRRIDIVIDFGTYGVGIENKPWAGEQFEQVKDYFTHLGGRYRGDFLLIYLSGAGQPPSSVEREELIRLDEQGRFRLLDYRMGLVAWLEECVRHCEAESVRWFLRDFMNYVVRTFDPPASNRKGESR